MSECGSLPLKLQHWLNGSFSILFFLFETLCKFLWLMFRNPLTLPMIFLIEVILLTKAVFIAQRVVFLYLD